MDEFATDEEQVEAIKKWWSENGNFVLGGLLVGLGALFGYRWHDARTEARLVEASVVYSSLLDAAQQNQRDRAATLATQLQNEFGGTEYAAQAALAMARIHMDDDEPADAAAQLEKALELSDDPQLRATARLRLARVQLYQSRAQRALETLDAGDAGGFQPLYDEVRGDALVALGREEEARDAYRNALSGFRPGLGDRRMVEMKLAAISAAEQDSGGES